MGDMDHGMYPSLEVSCSELSTFYGIYSVENGKLFVNVHRSARRIAGYLDMKFGEQNWGWHIEALTADELHEVLLDIDQGFKWIYGK